MSDITNPNQITMQAILVTPPPTLEKPNPNMQCIQLLLYSEGSETTGGMSVPLDLFGALAAISSQLQTVNDNHAALQQYTEDGFNAYDDRLAALEGDGPA